MINVALGSLEGFLCSRNLVTGNHLEPGVVRELPHRRCRFHQESCRLLQLPCPRAQQRLCSRQALRGLAKVHLLCAKSPVVVHIAACVHPIEYLRDSETIVKAKNVTHPHILGWGRPGVASAANIAARLSAIPQW